MKVIVNGKQRYIDATAIDYLGATELAHPGAPDGGLYTVTWKRPDGSTGSLVRDQKTAVVDGMILNVMSTNRA